MKLAKHENGNDELEQRLIAYYGVLLTQRHLAHLLGRSINGLRYSLSRPPDRQTEALRRCGRRVGRRVYYPASDVARIISRDGATQAPPAARSLSSVQ